MPFDSDHIRPSPHVDMAPPAEPTNITTPETSIPKPLTPEEVVLLDSLQRKLTAWYDYELRQSQLGQGEPPRLPDGITPDMMKLFLEIRMVSSGPITLDEHIKSTADSLNKADAIQGDSEIRNKEMAAYLSIVSLVQKADSPNSMLVSVTDNSVGAQRGGFFETGKMREARLAKNRYLPVEDLERVVDGRRIRIRQGVQYKRGDITPIELKGYACKIYEEKDGKSIKKGELDFGFDDNNNISTITLSYARGDDHLRDYGDMHPSKRRDEEAIATFKAYAASTGNEKLVGLLQSLEKHFGFPFNERTQHTSSVTIDLRNLTILASTNVKLTDRESLGYGKFEEYKSELSCTSTYTLDTTQQEPSFHLAETETSDKFVQGGRQSISVDEYRDLVTALLTFYPGDTLQAVIDQPTI